MDARALLRWTDLDERRRIGPARRWGQRAAIAGGLVALVAWRRSELGPAAALATWHSVITVAFAATMLATALGMFWRRDAALLARLPIDGRALLAAALVRAARGAAVCTGTVIVAAAPLVVAAPVAVWAPIARGLALAGVLAVATAALVPAAAAAAALIVAGGQATRATTAMVAVATGSPRAAAARAVAAATAPPTEKVPTTVLGALPGTAAAWMVILAITVRWWVTTGATTAVGPALPWLVAAVVVSVVALAAVIRRGAGMAIALREVAALDRQRLAHLEIHPPRGLEVVAMRALGERAGLIYGRYARLMRRRYPMAWALGFLAWVVAIGLAIGGPADAELWAIALAVFAGGYAVALGGRLRRAPVELPRLAAQLPIGAPAHARARVTWVVAWWLMLGAPPVAIAAAVAHAWVAPAAVAALGALAGIAVARRPT